MRKKAIDLNKEFENLHQAMTRFENKVNDRLFSLCQNNPNAPIGNIESTIVHAKSLADQKYINCLPIKDKLNFISLIEEHLRSLENITQTTINF